MLHHVLHCAGGAIAARLHAMTSRVGSRTPRVGLQVPVPLAKAARGTFAGVRGLLFDVDDTLTSHGRLTAGAYQALEAAATAGLWLCAVTGRGAGWCDMMVRLWPVAAVVGETGAFAYTRRKNGTVAETFLRSASQRARDTALRDRAMRRVLRTVPGARLARDSAFRLCDQALDLVEDGPAVSEATIARMMTMLAQDGLTVARSSVHINAWVGRYSKRQMVDRLLARVFGPTVARRPAAFVYVGDSRNDGPMFARFGLGVGVANVQGVLAELQALGQAPAYITAAPAGDGFAQVVAKVLAERPAARTRRKA